MSSRALPIASIATVGVLAWVWFVLVGRGMSINTAMMPGMPMPMGIGTLSVMWAAMMAAMMAPAAAPSYLLHARMSNNPPASWAYLTGYLGTWCTVGVAYAVAQWALQQAGLLNMEMRLGSGVIGGLVLVTAGMWQWSPAKAGCVARCRSPLGFMINEWRDGRAGAFVMGLEYAAWCVGCCWLLMTVLFVVGAMSYAWAVAIALYILAERLLPLGRVFDRAVGAGLVIWGAWLIAATLRA
jgi:predicted metal-binding membrane protein